MRQSWRWRFPSTLRIPTPVSLFFSFDFEIICFVARQSLAQTKNVLFIFWENLIFFPAFGFQIQILVDNFSLSRENVGWWFVFFTREGFRMFYFGKELWD
jgi:hypothetical protein